MGVADLWYENIHTPIAGTLRVNRIGSSTEYPFTRGCFVDLSFRQLDALGLLGEPTAIGIHLPVVQIGAAVTIRPGDQVIAADDDGRDYTWQVANARRTSFRSRWELVVVRERTNDDTYE